MDHSFKSGWLHAGVERSKGSHGQSKYERKELREPRLHREPVFTRVFYSNLGFVFVFVENILSYSKRKDVKSWTLPSKGTLSPCHSPISYVVDHLRYEASKVFSEF